MAFAEVSTGIISEFEAIVGEQNVIIDPENATITHTMRLRTIHFFRT